MMTHRLGAGRTVVRLRRPNKTKLATAQGRESNNQSDWPGIVSEAKVPRADRARRSNRKGMAPGSTGVWPKRYSLIWAKP